MSDNPEKFYMCSEGQLYEALADVDTVETYIRHDTHADLIAKADELSKAGACMMGSIDQLFPTDGPQKERFRAALSAYGQVREGK